jgi:hypothetical protein
MSQSVCDGAEVLSAAEVQSLIRAVLADGRKVTEQELERVVTWAEQVRIDVTLLDLVLDKQLGVAWVEGADAPKFWIRSERAA